AAPVPGLAARPIGLLSESEGRLLSRARWLMIAASAAVLLLAALAVLTTSVAGALDREPELALLKALGWEDGEAAALFLSEAALVGLAAGGVAAALGLAGGRGLARSLFHTTMAVQPLALLTAVATEA